VIAIGSVKGSPGATTLAAAMAVVWPGDPAALLVEADCAGGDLGSWHWTPDTPGVASLAAACRTGAVQLGEHVRRLPLGVDVLVGAAARSPATVAVGLLAEADHGLWAKERPTIVDVGRLEPDAPSSVLVTEAEVLLLVARGDEASLLRVADAKLPARDVRLVLVGGCRYHHDEITQLTGLPVAASVPWDPYSARVIAGQAGARKGWTRRGLPAAARALAVELAAPEVELAAPEVEGVADDRRG
jgi:hypothetical protein